MWEWSRYQVPRVFLGVSREEGYFIVMIVGDRENVLEIAWRSLSGK